MPADMMIKSSYQAFFIYNLLFSILGFLQFV